MYYSNVSVVLSLCNYRKCCVYVDEDTVHVEQTEQKEGTSADIKTTIKTTTSTVVTDDSGDVDSSEEHYVTKMLMFPFRVTRWLMVKLLSIPIGML